MRAAILAAGALLAASVGSKAAWACASCGCGDDTLTAMGVEKPLKNRVRLALEERFGGHTAGDPSYEEDSWTLRSSLSASWSPIARLTVAALVPVVTGWDRTGDQPWHHYTMLGDAELSVRGIVLQDRKWSPHHIVSALVGLKLPTGPRAYDETGYPLADDVQPGSGSWDPFAGAGYAWFGKELSFYSSVSYRYTTVGRNRYRRGQSVGGTVGLQFQPLGVIAFSVAADVRWAAADALPGGIDTPNTGGAMVALTPSLIVSPVDNWLIKLSAQLHVADAFNGTQTESHALVLSTVVDLN